MAQNIIFSLKADTSGIKAGMTEAQNATKGVSKQVSVLDSQFAKLGGLVGGAFAVSSVIEFGKAVAKVSAEVQSLQTRLNSISGSEGAGLRAMEDLSRMADKLGLDFMDLTNSYVQFVGASKASGMEVRKAEQIFKSMSVAIAGSGANAESAKRAMTALTQMIGKGTISAEELRGQLGEAIPSAMGIMAKSMGVSVKELGKMMEKGQLLSNEVLPKFAKEMENAFGADAQKLSQGLQANINRLSNEWTKFMGEVGKSSIVSGAVDVLSASVKALGVAWATVTFNVSEYLAKKDRQEKLDKADEASRNVIKQINNEISSYGDAELALEQLTLKYNNLSDEVDNMTKRIEANRSRRLGVKVDIEATTADFVQQAYNKTKYLELLGQELDYLRQSSKESGAVTAMTKEQAKAIEKEKKEREKILELQMKRLRFEGEDTEPGREQDIFAISEKAFIEQFNKWELDSTKRLIDEKLKEQNKEYRELERLRNRDEINQQEYLNRRLLLDKKYAKESADTEDELFRLLKEKRQKEIDDEIKLKQDQKAMAVDLAGQTASGIADIVVAQKQNELNSQQALVEEQRQKGLISEEQYQSQVRAIKRKQMMMDKIAAISQIAINTAIALTNPTNIASFGAISPFIIASGAVSAGLVLAQPIPYNKGTKRVPMMRGAIRGKDSVHAILTPDERVVPADINTQPGYSALLDLAQDRKISDKEAGFIAEMAMGGRVSSAQAQIDPDVIGKAIAKYIPHTSVRINERGIAVITEQSKSEVRRLRTRIG